MLLIRRQRMKFKLQGQIYKASTIYKNLESWYLVNPDNGHDWYNDARQLVSDLSAKHEVPKTTVAGIISALSPQKSWHENIKLADKVLSGSTRGHTRGQLNKAYQIMLTEQKGEICAILHGLKTVNFFLNLIGDPDAVTVDRHIIKASLGHELSVGITNRQYLIIEDQVRIIAKKHNKAPSAVQAIIWSNIRDEQTEDWHKKEVTPF